MRNLLLDPKEFAKEIEVIKEERRLRTEDKPKSQAFELFNATAYRVSPYRNPVIGWMKDLEQLKAEDLRAWYQRWYAPNNAILVVVGDVKPEEILQLAQRYYGVLPPSDLPEHKQEVETAQQGLVRMQVKVPALQPYLLMGYKTPVINQSDEEWEPYALEMLVAVLSGGDSSRISRDIVRGQELAVSADADYSGFRRLPGMLLLDAVPAKKHSVADVEAALLKEIQRLKTEPVSDQELARVRNQLLASKVYERDSVFYQAMQIGMLEAMGMDWRLAENYVDRMKKVTAEQVMQVAKKYLREDNLTVAELIPQPMKKKKGFARPSSLGARHVN
jgi:zinc protease